MISICIGIKVPFVSALRQGAASHARARPILLLMARKAGWNNRLFIH